MLLSPLYFHGKETGVSGQVMRMEMGGKSFEVELYDNAAVRDLVKSLPQKISMSRWGDEYYGTLGVKITSSDPKQDVFAVGEVALWPSGNAFCIFFGPTPASRGSEPRMASPGVPLGKIKGDVSALKGMGSSLSGVTLSLKQ